MELITDGRKLKGAAMPERLAAFQKAAIGRTIKTVGYLQFEDGEAEVWPCIGLDDGTFLIVQSDDEANAPGVVVFADEDKDITLCQTEAK
jgi:hypothetical protein